MSAFNEMLGRFYDEMLVVFPDNQALNAAKSKPRTRLTLERFMKQTAARAHHLTAKNDAFFTEKNKFMKEIGMCEVWSKCTPEVKEKVWAYLSNLYMLGTSVQMIPPQMMSVIENAAESCSKDVMTEDGQLDQDKLMQSVNSMMSQILKSGNLLGNK